MRYRPYLASVAENEIAEFLDARRHALAGLAE
jgi:hypothetical protein